MKREGWVKISLNGLAIYNCYISPNIQTQKIDVGLICRNFAIFTLIYFIAKDQNRIRNFSFVLEKSLKFVVSLQIFLEFQRLATVLSTALSKTSNRFKYMIIYST